MALLLFIRDSYKEVTEMLRVCYKSDIRLMMRYLFIYKAINNFPNLKTFLIMLQYAQYQQEVKINVEICHFFTIKYHL
jgi:hypothetical protein